ncbi:hypothetical protein [Actinoalloteichus caeruleus]|uniref:hypothetical protein n=1 Tax=Actinoalloteichus cyanogriseus TaxID=2893586 RepID=UPI003BB959AB
MRSDYEPPSVVPASAPATPAPGSVRPVPVTHTNGIADAALVQQQQEGPEPGAWYVWQCTGEGWADAFYRPPIWIPDGEEPGQDALPSPAELAALARDQLRLPSPEVRLSPADEQLVHLPTWLWLTPPSWGEQSASASVPGISVTAFARPRAVTWTTGDGATITCDGPGTPFPADGDPEAASPDCGHVYRTASVGEPGAEFAVTATVHWTISWSGGGDSGTFPELTTETTTSVRVVESHALNTG